MRLSKNKRTDFGEISRRSVARDFYPERIYIREKKIAQNENSHKITCNKPETDAKRILSINPICEYARYARYFVGKLVRLVNHSGVGDSTTGWYEFVHDEDRLALNAAAGWSENKKMYLLERPKFR